MSTYLWNNIFSFIMSPVADTDLSQFLAHMDSLDEGLEKDGGYAMLLSWPGCLIRALDYIHEMRVKHRDIKPSNILIKGNIVYFTDFGISKVVPEEFTTGTDGTFGPMTRIYVAPEALVDNARRGRAMDIFSLGCVFLEMGTVVITPKGSIERFRKIQRTAGSMAYAQTAPEIAAWIQNLWDRLNIALDYDLYIYEFAPILFPSLTFLMLDPNPDCRITSRQLIAMIYRPELPYIASVNGCCCMDCGNLTVVKDDNLPLHSIFKNLINLKSPEFGGQILEEPVEPNWEGLKRAWLKHHMWW
jgi:serine/threonine protein kinase